MRHAWLFAAVAALSMASALPLGAQWRADAVLGGARVTQPENPARSAATATASLAWLHQSLAVAGSGAVTLPDGGDRRVHAELGAALRSHPRRRFGVEATGSVSAYDETRFPHVLSGFAGLRLHARASRLGVWGGAATGTLDDGSFTYPHSVWEAGMTGGWRAVRLSASASRNNTVGEPRIEFVGDPPLQVTVRDDLRYTDAVLAVQVRPSRVELDARIGTRSVQRTIAYEDLPPDRLFGDVSAAWQVTPRVALALSYGHELADLARGLPEARFATLGMRVRLYDSSPAVGRPVTRRPVTAGAAPDVLVEQGGSGGVKLRVLASSSARTIEAAGTFTDWEPVRLIPEGSGAWSLAAPVQPGRHRIMVRVDGGAWMAPANLPSVDDEVGGRVGLFTVIE